MSPKSLVVAKVLGGGVAGASGVVGAGYGITKYFKSGESETTTQEAQNNVATEENESVVVERAGTELQDSLDSQQPDQKSKVEERQLDDSQIPTSPDQSQGEQTQTLQDSSPSSPVEEPASPSSEIGSPGTDSEADGTITPTLKNN